MATGQIKNWFSDRGFGFITNDAGGPDIFLHITAVQENEREFLGRGRKVDFDIQRTDRGLRASNVRLQVVQESKAASDEAHFHNPYTFVPTPPRPSSGFAGDFNPLKKGLDHASLKKDLWTGHIPIKLTTVTPLVLLKSDGEERDTRKHQTYDVLDYIPESSLRGMLRNAYEVVTNSRYACFRNDDRLAYRMIPQQSLELIPAIIENGSKPGELKARLYPGTSDITPQRPDGQMYAAMLGVNSKYVNGGEPKTRDEVWAEIERRQHRRYEYWKVVRVWSKRTQPTKPAVTGKVVEGRVLITNENMGNKHDERIFFVDGANAKNPIKRDVTHLKEAWRMRIQSYRDAHSESDIFDRSRARNQPWKKIGRDPGDTAWSPHLYEDGRHTDRWGRATHDALELQAGDMVYARCKFDSKGKVKEIEDLFPVMISRELYDDSPGDLLDSSLRPANKLSELSPADRLFGWVPQQKQDSSQESSGGYKSRIRVVCEGGQCSNSVEKIEGGPLPLTILGQPKPAQGRFYVAEDDKGTPQHGKNKRTAGYKANTNKRLRGRKQYWHHKGLEAGKAPDYWQASAEDRTQHQTNGRYQEYRRPNKFDNGTQQFEQQTDSQNRSIKGWIKPGTVFKASLYVQNLQSEEVGALLWLLSLSKGHYFRLGYGKPLGFGSISIEIDVERLVKGCLPLGTREDWKAYYEDLNASSPATLDDRQRGKCIQQFKEALVAAYNPLSERSATENSHGKVITSLNQLESVQSSLLNTSEKRFDALPFIKGFLQVLRGPEDDAPIHYPRSEHIPNPEGKNFEWFRDNESNKKLALPDVTNEDGLPYKP
ncbi:TIGR03986 family CRISPR-associated RAMP protein [Candidatus Poribacteria bacterium]|nr:MAG: TIGR03986 family CRISPR-associated RAMP protein [Candidatus Poribacteria bacterium]